MAGSEDGVLLRAAVDAGFEVTVTADKSLRHQQNLPSIGIGIVVIFRLRKGMRDLLPLVPRIFAAIDEVEPGQLVAVTG